MAAEPHEIELENIFDENAADSTTGDGYKDEPSRKEARPQVVKGRESAANIITLAWGGIGAMLMQTGVDVPVGRTLQFQAPIAGAKFDALLAGTFLDEWLQPFIRQSEKVEGVGSLIMFPLLVGLYERSEEWGAVLEPILREVIAQNLVQMAPVIRKRKNDQRAAARAMKDITEAFGDDLPKGADPVQMILQNIFAPPPNYQPPPPDEPSYDTGTEE